MANNEEDEQEPNPISTTGMLDVNDPNIRDFFANDVYVDLTESETSLLFTFSFFANGVKVYRPGIRIILSHSNFVHMVEFMEKRAHLLRRVYKGAPPNIYVSGPEELNLAFQELYSSTNETPIEVQEEQYEE